MGAWTKFGVVTSGRTQPLVGLCNKVTFRSSSFFELPTLENLLCIEAKKYFRNFIMVIIAVLLPMTFTSCSVFTAIGGFFWGLIKGLFWIAAILVTLTLWIAYIVYDRTDEEIEYRRFHKRVSQTNRYITEFFDWLATEAIWISIFSFFGFLFSVSMLFKGLPLWFLIIVTLVQCGVIIGKWEKINTKPFYIWLSSIFIFTVIFHILGLTEFTIIFNSLAFIPEFIRNIFGISTDTSFEFTTNFLITLVVSGVLALIPALILQIILSKQLQAEIEHKILIKQEKEAKRKREEEIDRNRSFEEKLAILNKNEQKTIEKQNKTLQKAKREYSRYRSANPSEPEVLLAEHKNSNAESIFTAGLGDAFFGGGVERAKAYYQELGDIFKYYAARYIVEVCKAKLANSKYIFIKKRAILYAGQLKEIYSTLTDKQKVRTVENRGPKFQIGTTSIKVDDTLKAVDIKISEHREVMKEANSGLLKDYAKFSGKLDSGGEDVGTFLLGMAIGNLIANYEDRKEIKEELGSAYNKLIRKLDKIEADRIKATIFEKRVSEINKSLSKAFEAYTKVFDNVYAALYPQDDPAMSKEQRQFRKNSGGTYFSDEEAEAVIQLGRTGQFLLDLVDTTL